MEKKSFVELASRRRSNNAPKKSDEFDGIPVVECYLDDGLQSQSVVVRKEVLAQRLELHLRDLRSVTTLSPKNESSVHTHHKALVISLEGIQLVLTHDKATLFHPNGEQSIRFLYELRNYFSDFRYSHSHSPTDHEQESFENSVLECIMSLACDRVNEALEEIMRDDDLQFISREFNRKPTMKDLIKQSGLHPIKMRLQGIKKRAFALSRALTGLLDEYTAFEIEREKHEYDRASSIHQKQNMEDNHINSFHSAEDKATLTEEEAAVKGSNNGHQHSRLNGFCENMILNEFIIEEFILRSGWVLSEADSVLDEIINKETEAAFQLDLMQNRLIRYAMYISVGSFVVACATVVAGVFGMNLGFPHHLLDTTGVSFNTVVSVIAVAIPGVTAAISAYGHWRQFIP